jgi:ferredoxin
MKSVLMDLSGVFADEGWDSVLASDPGNTILRLRDVEGTRGYCCPDAEDALMQAMASCPLDAIHWIDTGDYHYISALWLRKLEEPSALFLFDHHSDDQPPAIAGLRSCGSWRLDIMEENKSLRSSLLIRSREDLEKLMNEGVAGDLPIYISVDKDILSEKVLHTNWDQGDLSEAELSDALSMLMDTGRVTALDICGEDLPDMPFEDNKSFNTRMIEGIMKE